MNIIEYDAELETIVFLPDIEYVEDENGKLVYSENVDRVVILREEK